MNDKNINKVKINEETGWNLYYLIDLRTKQIIDRCDGIEEVKKIIEEYKKNKRYEALLENLEVVKAIGWSFPDEK